MMWNGFDGMGWGWIGLGMVHMALFWILVVLGIIVLVRWLGYGSAPHADKRAVDILKERYAKGDLTREQFDQMKRDVGD